VLVCSGNAGRDGWTVGPRWAIFPLRVRWLFCYLAFALLAGSVACASAADNTKLNLPPPVESTTVGPGDVFQMQIVGEKDLPAEYQIASDGTVDLPYLNRVEVKGLEPQEIARLIRTKLIEKQILTNPSVVVSVKEYNSKRIVLLGQVQKPGSFPLSPGLTLIQAVSLAGGFTSIANTSRVNLTRSSKGGSRTVQVNLDEITGGRSPDIPLQAGDRIYVYERIF
jgi:polysaccharide biosynthesis/export protein VpsN